MARKAESRANYNRRTKRSAKSTPEPKKEATSASRRALEKLPVGAHVQPGKRAIEAKYRQLIRDEVAVECSLNLDAATEALRRKRGERCWDYVAAVLDHAQPIAIEVHPCHGGSIDEMREKKAWSQRFLDTHSIGITQWFWLVPPNATIGIRRGSSEEKRLLAAGIRMPQRVLEGKDLKPSAR